MAESDLNPRSLLWSITLWDRESQWESQWLACIQSLHFWRMIWQRGPFHGTVSLFQQHTLHPEAAPRKIPHHTHELLANYTSQNKTKPKHLLPLLHLLAFGSCLCTLCDRFLISLKEIQFIREACKWKSTSINNTVFPEKLKPQNVAAMH
jgi:hypothetical protein